eukprot:5134476-Alexandrium_andersonii.AAC.1
MLRVATQLERSGRPLAEAEMEKLVGKGQAEFSRVLLDDSFEEAEYNGRLEALMDLLRARGGEPSSSARKLFSTAGSQGVSQEASPDKGAG